MSTQTQLLNFLNVILPPEGVGLRCGVALKQNGSPQQAFFDNNAALAAFLQSASVGGWDAYHACATYRDSSSRAASNAFAVQALWLDVDAGEGKPYADTRAAAEATFSFAQRANLPLPLLVSSGYGVHAYWAITETLDPSTWLQWSTKLKAACVQLGLRVGPERTADVASILRPPGTLNFKRGGSAEVRILGNPTAVPFSMLAPLAHIEAAPVVVRSAARVVAPLAAAAANIHAEAPADPDMIAERCAQLRAMRDTGGCMPEPVWHACIGVLTHCFEGEEVTHDWSQGDTRYSEEETQRKYELAMRNSGPTTCARFNDINPEGCVGCPFAGKVTTPVQLGRSTAASPSAAAPFAPQAVRGEILPYLPHPFSWGPGASVVVEHEMRNGEMSSKLVLQSPLYLHGVSCGELRGDSYYYTLRHLLPKDGWKEISISARELWGNQGLAVIGGKGVVVEDGELFRKYMRDSVNDYYSKRTLSVMFEQCGWKENDSAFLVGNRLYRASGMEYVPGTNEVMYRAKMLTPKAGGSLENWVSCASKLFGIGRESQSFALLASLGAPLIRFLATDEGGAIVSLVSRQSGKGKSTAMAGATTVWGEPSGLQLVNIDTAVSKGLTFGVMGNLPVIFDELASRDPEIARDFVEVFTNGRDKMRGTQTGEIHHVLARWQTLLITASNVSLCDAIKAGGGSDATTYRILELPLLPLPAHVHVHGDHIRDGLFNNWGYAGDHFMRYLVQPDVLAWAKQHVVRTQQSLIAEHGFRAEHRFWVRTIACCATAGTIAAHIGLIDFPVEGVIKWVLEHCRVRAAEQSIENAQEGTALGVLTAFMNDKISEMLVMPEEFRPRTVGQIPRVKPLHRMTMRYNIKPGQLFIVERDLRLYLAKREYGVDDFCTELAAQGILLARRRAINLGAGTDFASGATPCMEFNMNHPALTLTAKSVETIAATGALANAV